MPNFSKLGLTKIGDKFIRVLNQNQTINNQQSTTKYSIKNQLAIGRVTPLFYILFWKDSFSHCKMYSLNQNLTITLQLYFIYIYRKKKKKEVS